LSWLEYACREFKQKKKYLNLIELKLNEEKRRVPGRGTKKFVAEEDKTVCGATGVKPRVLGLN